MNPTAIKAEGLPIRLRRPEESDIKQLADLAATLGFASETLEQADEWVTESDYAKPPSIKAGYVLESGSVIMACCFYEVHIDALKVYQLLVHPDYQRQRWGSFLLYRLGQHAQASVPKATVYLEIDEDDLAMCKFMRALGWRARVQAKNVKPDSGRYVDRFRFTMPRKIIVK